jgi:hypothetical protein
VLTLYNTANVTFCIADVVFRILGDNVGVNVRNIELAIAKYLTGASDRNGGRKRRSIESTASVVEVPIANEVLTADPLAEQPPQRRIIVISDSDSN